MYFVCIIYSSSFVHRQSVRIWGNEQPHAFVDHNPLSKIEKYMIFYVSSPRTCHWSIILMTTLLKMRLLWHVLEPCDLPEIEKQNVILDMVGRHYTVAILSWVSDEKFPWRLDWKMESWPTRNSWMWGG